MFKIIAAIVVAGIISINVLSDSVKEVIVDASANKVLVEQAYNK